MIKTRRLSSQIHKNESTGIFMEFENRNIISIQWGKGTYSSHRDCDEAKNETVSAEVCVGNKDVDWDDFLDPIGWCEVEEVALLIFIASTMEYKSEEMMKAIGEMATVK